MQKIKIIGCGSLLMGDDAVGCVIARKLQEEEHPDNITILEAGTPGLGLLSLMKPGEKVIIIDAVVTGRMPVGKFRVFSEDEIPQPGEMPLSAHSIAIPETIALGRRLEPEEMPEHIEIWGIEIEIPKSQNLGDMKMSKPVADAVSKVMKKIKREVINPPVKSAESA